MKGGRTHNVNQPTDTKNFFETQTNETNLTNGQSHILGIYENVCVCSLGYIVGASPPLCVRLLGYIVGASPPL